MNKFAILDFEASSLSDDSWPIEVALSWLDVGGVHTWSSLICPAPDWSLAEWSPQSAAVHNIPLSDLKSAPSVSDVMQAFSKVLGARRLLSDAPEFEKRWLIKLFRADGRDEIPPVGDYHEISSKLYSGYALDMLYETLERRAAPHRAGPDSARLAFGWLKASKHQVSMGQRNTNS
ncbi:3'-5' exonuclease [Sulfitobacter sp. M13]